MYDNIPLELRQRLQWVVWRYETLANGKLTKVPYTPAGTHASVTDPATWCDFVTACEAARAVNMSGIGFVLTHGDPYCIIDLDNKLDKPIDADEWKVHERILNAFPCYTERSVSGRGYHIVFRGTLAQGRRRGNVEVYSAERYMAFTGDVVRNAPIVEMQQMLDMLIADMPHSKPGGELEDADALLTDAELHEMAARAVNGAKYEELCLGDWASMGYNSQSEADFALLAILAFYTRDNEQVRRLFRYSALGKRDKATKDNRYLDTNLRRIRANQPKAADYEEVARTAERLKQDLSAPQAPAAAAPAPPSAPPPPVATPAPPAPHVPAHAAPVADPAMYPPGLVGALAHYIFNSSVRPVYEISIAAAIGFLAGIAGRQYNISGTGLNQYLLVVSRTGAGKEGGPDGIERLCAAVRPNMAMIDEYIGPGAFASGQALIRVLDQRQSFVCVMGEFGLTLQQLNDPRANSATIMLKKVLLDLFAKSGWNKVLRSTAYSDQEKNTKSIHAPNVTILGDATPETFYDAISSADIADGLIPRFHIIEYTGKRPKRNRNAGHPPDAQLLAQFKDLVVQAVTMQQNRTCAPVQLMPDAQAMLDAYDEECDDHMRSSTNTGETQLWNRAHLKALKMAALLAVGCDPKNPVITAELAQWAIAFTNKGTRTILDRFESGDVGSGELKQESELRRVVREYFGYTRTQLHQYRLDADWQTAGVIPYSYFLLRLQRVAAFYKDRNGAARALRAALETAVAQEMLSLVPAGEAKAKFGTSQALYFPTKRYWG